jgi:exosortase
MMIALRQFVAWESRAARSPRLAWGIVFLLAVSCFSLHLTLHLANLWKKEHYQFAPILIIACCCIAAGRWREARQGKLFYPRFRIHPIPAVVTVLAYGLAVWVNSPWCGFLSMIAFLWLLARNVPFMVGPVLLLAILLPLPLMIDLDVVHGLQRISSRGASVLLDLSGIAHVPEGNIVETADRRFFVEEACSGFGSVYMLLAVAGLIVVLKRLRPCVALPLLLCAPVWAVAANILRIFAVVWAHVRYGTDLASGMHHEVLGIGTYVLAVIGLLISEQALLFLMSPVGTQGLHPAGTRRGDFERTLITFWDDQTNGEWSFLQTRAMRRGISGVSASFGGAPLFCSALLLLCLSGWAAVEACRFAQTSGWDIPGVPSAGHEQLPAPGSRSAAVFGQWFLKQELPDSDFRVVSYESAGSDSREGMSERWKIEYQQRQWIVESTERVTHLSPVDVAEKEGLRLIEQQQEVMTDSKGRPYTVEVVLAEEAEGPLRLSFVVRIDREGRSVEPSMSLDRAGTSLMKRLYSAEASAGVYQLTAIVSLTAVPDLLTRETLQQAAWRMIVQFIENREGMR